MNTQDQQSFKGAGFKAMVRALNEMYGEAAVKRVIEACGPELRSFVAKKTLDNVWLPDRVGTDLVVTADRLLGKGDFSLIRKVGYCVAKDNLTGIYKIYVKMSSISGLLKRADQIWRQYFNTGNVKVLLAEKKHFQFEVVDYTPYPDTCIGVLGWLDMFLEVYKVKGVASHPDCKLKGQGHCIFDITLE
jgi:hypothetical protein